MSDNSDITKVVFFSTRMIENIFNDNDPEFSEDILKFFTINTDFTELKEKLTNLASPDSSESTLDSSARINQPINFDNVKNELIEDLSKISTSLESIVDYIKKETGECRPYSLDSLKKADAKNIGVAISYFYSDFECKYRDDISHQFRILDQVFSKYKDKFIATPSNEDDTRRIDSNIPKINLFFRKVINFFKRKKSEFELSSENRPNKKNIFNEDTYNKIKNMELGDNKISFRCDKNDMILVKHRLGVYVRREEGTAVCAVWPWEGDFVTDNTTNIGIKNKFNKVINETDISNKAWVRLLAAVAENLFPNLESLLLMLHDKDIYYETCNRIIVKSGNFSLAAFTHNNASVIGAMNSEYTPEQIYNAIFLYLYGPDNLKDIDEQHLNALEHRKY